MIRVIRAVRPEVRVMLLGVLLANIGTFMVAPMLALYLSREQTLSASEIGSVLGVLLVCQQGLTFLGGLLSDRLGRRSLLVLGIAARIAGYLLFTTSGSFATSAASAALVGIGGALFSPAAKAAIAAGAGEHRSEAFALRSMGVNIGAAVGPLLGALLFPVFRIAFLATAGIYGVFLVLVLRLSPRLLATKSPVSPIRAGFQRVLSDRSIVLFMLVTSGFWLAHTQFSLTLPLYAHDRFGVDSMVGVLFTLSAVMSIAFQYWLLAWAGRRLSHSGTLALGMAAMALGFALVPAISFLPTLFAFTVLFTVGEILVAPTIDTVASYRAPAGSEASYLGFVSLGWGLGGTAGSFLGGVFYDAMKHAGTLWLVWAGYGLFAGATAVCFRAMGRVRGRRSPVEGLGREAAASIRSTTAGSAVLGTEMRSAEVTGEKPTSRSEG